MTSKAESPTRPLAHSHFRILWFVAVSVSLALWAGNLFLGMLNQDEGWYLYGARLVAEGQLPYRDFAFTQGPVMLYVYALGNGLVSAFGVAGGRLLTVLFGVAGSVCAALLAGRLAKGKGGGGAALLAFMLIAVNAYQSYFTAVVKTYALAGFFLVLGFFLLTMIAGKKGMWMAFFSGICLALATGTRVSALPAIPIVFLVLLLSLRKSDQSLVRPRVLVTFAAGASLALAAVFLPYLLISQDSFLFCTVHYHAGREGGGLMVKAGSISRLVAAYFVPAALLLICIMHKLFDRREKDSSRVVRSPWSVVSSIWLSITSIALIHFLAPFPYDEYQVMVFPLFAAALAAWCVSLLNDAPIRRYAHVIVLLLCLAAVGSSSIIQDWVVLDIDRLWLRTREEPSLVKLSKVADRIRELAGDADAQILTQDPYLAVESGLKLPAALVMGQFSYYPDMDRKDAERRHVLNAEMLREMLRESDAPVAAFSGYGLAVRSPQVTELGDEEKAELQEMLESRYEFVEAIEHFGQADTTLRIYKLNEL